MIEGRRVLITGGAGFIGTSLARRLVGANQVVLFDNLHRNAVAGTELMSHPSLQLVEGDVLDAAALAAAMRGCQIVIHLAAIAGVDTVLKMPVTTMKVSLFGTYNALEAARESGVERFVDFSTSEVFGTYAYKVSEGDVTHLGAVGEARWTYAVSKLATEHLAFNYHVQYGLPSISIRPFNIYGPGQVGEGAIHRFIVRALAGDPLEVHNDGAQIRAWCYIDDIVEAVIECLDRPDAVGHAFNVGNPRSVCTIHDLASRIIQLSGSPSELRFVDWPHADVELRVPDIQKARRVLGWEPRVDLDAGLKRTIDWYRERKP
jgi:nucleoside-diphosphate-sugar epimerase